MDVVCNLKQLFIEDILFIKGRLILGQNGYTDEFQKSALKCVLDSDLIPLYLSLPKIL